MQELISRLVDATGITPELAEKVIGIILNFLNKEAPADAFHELLAAIPGAKDLVVEESSKGGLMASLAGTFGGMGAMGVVSDLTSAGLSMGHVQTVTRQVIDYAREKVGDETVGRIVGNIPGLEQFL